MSTAVSPCTIILRSKRFVMATVEPYNLNWPAGEDKMLVVSVGTGTSPYANADLRPDEMNVLYNATSIPSALMFAALNEQDFLCRVFGRCLAGDPLDREVGDMIGKRGPVQPKLFTYLRYNAELTRAGLDELDLDRRGAHATCNNWIRWSLSGICNESENGWRNGKLKRSTSPIFECRKAVTIYSAGNSHGA